MILPGRKYKIINGSWTDMRSGQSVVDQRDINELNERAGFTAEPKKYDEAIKTNKQMLDIDPGNKEAMEASKNLLDLKNQEIFKQLGMNSSPIDVPDQSLSAINPESQSGGGYIENADGTGRVSIEDLLGLSSNSQPPSMPINNNQSSFFNQLSKELSPSAATSGSKIHNVTQGARSLDELSSMSNTPGIGDEMGGLLQKMLTGAQDLVGGSAFDLTQAIKDSAQREPVFGKDNSNPSIYDQIFNTKYNIPELVSSATDRLTKRISEVFSSPQEREQAMQIVKQEKAKGRTDAQIEKDLEEYFGA